MPQTDYQYSDEAQEILGRVPAWIVRWGVTVVFIIFAGILVGCYFIKYPDTVQAPITITTINPPADLAARYAGLLATVYVSNGQQVRRGQLLMLLATPADYGDVEAVEIALGNPPTGDFAALVSAPWIGREYRLGELQSTYAQFQQKCLDYDHYLRTGHVALKRQLLAEQIAKNEEYYARLKQQQRLLQRDLQCEAANLRRDSMLLSEAVIASADYETSARSMIQKQNTKAGFDATMTSTELSILQTRQQLVELTLQEENERASYERELNQLRQQLRAQIAQWREQYVVTAPADGRVSLQHYWNKNQRVKIGDILASVVPDGSTQVVGRMQIPSAGFGKVAPGQSVHVRLNGFPYMEFGVLRGTIRSISEVPEQSQSAATPGIIYIAEVVFSEGMRTSYKHDLPMIQQMDGTGEIITKQMRLIERFIQPVVSLFKNR